MNAHRYFLLNKPMNMVSQFVSTHQVNLLSNINFDFPEGTHAIGRLDQMSEGLLLLTTNKKVTKLLFQGIRPHVRTYLVQVKNKVHQDTLKQLQSGNISTGQYLQESAALLRNADRGGRGQLLYQDNTQNNPINNVAINTTTSGAMRIRGSGNDNGYGDTPNRRMRFGS